LGFSESETADEKVVDIVLKRHPVEEQILEEARQEANTEGVPLTRVLVERSVVSSDEMTLAFSEYLNMPPISLEHFSPDKTVLDAIPRDVMARHSMIPVAASGRLLTVALGDPFDVLAVDAARQHTGYAIIPVVAWEKDVVGLLHRFNEDSGEGLEEILRDVGEGEIEVDFDDVGDQSLDDELQGAEQAPVIRIVNSIMIEAIRKHASDIHIEPMERSIRLRYRIDGVLYDRPSPPKALQAAITSRAKIMSSLDIAERRIPQDGRFKIRAVGKEVDIRISLLPTVHGEKIVMRILDKGDLAPSVSSLGLDQKALDAFVHAIEQPHGMILVTGPTGSGKTTTLYSALQELNRPSVNIITVEDPVEYQLHGINQVQTHSDVGLTFAAGLRSILRQDPDIVMVGEIRDGETASIATQAALTGHLVLSTLHTNDAAGAIARMLYMGIEPFLLASSVIMTQAQRLYRKLCPACKRERHLDPEYLEVNNLSPDRFADTKIYEAKGCPKCNDTGYRGRGAIMEILAVDDNIRELILKEENAGNIRIAAVANGMQTLREVGLSRVAEGLTSIEEILRVTSTE